jgi:phosphatidylglycerol---prolipoprotein diacylglyceryl transferase
MLPVIQIGSLALQLPLLILFISLWIGISLSEKQSSALQLPASQISNLIITGLVTVLVGARLVFVIDHWEVFRSHLIDIFSFTPALLDLQSGILIGVSAVAILMQRKNMPVWKTLDGLVPFLAVIAVGIDLMNLASGNGYGTPTNLPWGIPLIGMKRHPSQLYEALAAILILWLMLPIRYTEPLKISTFKIPGIRFIMLVGFSAGARLFLDAFRANPAYLWGGIHNAQVIAWMIMAGCIWLYNLRKQTLQSME